MQEKKDNKKTLRNAPLTDADTDNKKIRDVLREEQSKIIKEVNMDINSDDKENSD